MYIYHQKLTRLAGWHQEVVRMEYVQWWQRTETPEMPHTGTVINCRYPSERTVDQ